MKYALTFLFITSLGLTAACTSENMTATDQHQRYTQADAFTNPAGEGDFGPLDDVPMNYLPSPLGK